ncbi:hypothetical protein BDV95DRAFT_266329 [Massariosphaeria phaeospora]|uniref:F-box domain-containing protein n=1 Tax=Massariosphaeria phaeospora TaxID=100035 RepID=A0A7C8I5Q1_9PLEO|nr:hypothetical protein BDV95DRAFT_266329 [Massariosphaeria phaeospora]
MSIFPWLLISILLVFRWPGSRILLYGLIDLGLAILLAIGIGIQAAYLPADPDSCSNAAEWQIVGDGQSLFTVAAEVAGGSATFRCKQFVSAWVVAVCALIPQMLISYIGVFFDGREHSLLNPVRPFYWFVLLLLIIPLFIYEQVLPRVRFSTQYVVKLYRRTREQEVQESEQAVPYMPRYEHIQVANPKLQHVLNIEHVLLNVVYYMHYEDVINLGRASKAVRESVYPGRDLDYRIPKLKKHSCDNDQRGHCLYCNKQICLECKSEEFAPALPGRRHVKACQAFCRKCYYKQVSKHAPQYKKPCKCHALDRGFEFQDMCRTCAQKDITEMQAARHRRYQQEASDIASGKRLKAGEKTKCGHCMSELDYGTRFWVCGECNGECRDKIHPPYVKRKREYDVERAEGQVETSDEDGQWWSTWTKLFRRLAT